MGKKFLAKIIVIILRPVQFIYLYI